MKGLTGIDSSALGDDRSQGIVERSRVNPWVDPFQSARRTENVWPGRQDSVHADVHSRSFSAANQISILPWPESCARLGPWIVRERE